MIPVLAVTALFFLGLRLLVISMNVVFHYRSKRKPYAGTKKISVLIPARNEEAHLSRILDGVLQLDYANYEIWVCDDHSTDQTPLILKEYSQQHTKVNWFRADPLKAGWTGKNAACFQLAGKATGELLLFLDADMEISGDILSRMSGYLETNRLKLLSIFPKQEMKSRGERATVPLMNWILLSLLPLPMVRFSPRSSFSAANGQFMLFQARTYLKLQPHRILRSSPVEDIGIMKLFKNEGYSCITLLGDNRVRCRMYSTYREAILGFSKNVLHFFSESRIWLLFFVIFTTFGLLFIGMWSLTAFLFALPAALLSRMLISLISYQHPGKNLLMLPLQHASFFHMVWKALRQKSRGSLQWKDREISLS